MLDQLLHVRRLHNGTPSRPERDVRVEAHCHIASSTRRAEPTTQLGSIEAIDACTNGDNF
jgi:hypothetical protein